MFYKPMLVSVYSLQKLSILFKTLKQTNTMALKKVVLSTKMVVETTGRASTQEKCHNKGQKNILTLQKNVY